MSRPRSAVDKAIRGSWINYTIAVFAILAIGVAFFTFVRQASDKASSDAKVKAVVDCVTEWANATSARSTYLNTYLLPRNDAQNAFEIAIANNAPKTTVDRLRTAFIAASTAYQNAQAKAPLPPPPLIRCGAGPEVASPSPVPVTTPPIHPATRTPTTGGGGSQSGAGVGAGAAQTPASAPASPSAAPTSQPTAPAPRTVTRTATATPPPSAGPTPLLPIPGCTLAVLNVHVC